MAMRSLVRLYHPAWTHTPAIALFLAAAATFLRTSPPAEHGGVLVIAVQHTQALSRTLPPMRPVPAWVWIAGGLAVLAAVAIEAIRPARHEQAEAILAGRRVACLTTA
jgi:hypothetical protein